MIDTCRCVSCSSPLEPAQELRFLVETANLDNPAYLAQIRRLPAVKGKPIPVCKSCQTRLEATPRHPVKPKTVDCINVLTAIGFISVGWLLQTLLASPRS